MISHALYLSILDDVFFHLKFSIRIKREKQIEFQLVLHMLNIKTVAEFP